MSQSIFEISTIFFVGMLIGAISSIFYHSILNRKRIKTTEKEAKRIINKAKAEAHRIEKKAELKSKDLQISMRKEHEKQIKQEQQNLQREHDKLQLKKSKQEEEHQRLLADLKEQDQSLEIEKESFKKDQAQLQELIQQKKNELQKINNQLESIAQMTQAEAEETIKENVKKELELSLAPELKEMEQDLKRKVHEKSQHLLAVALAKQASQVTTEQTAISIPVSGDDGKGKIIGREGRNIRSLENACGVDLLIEEGQDVVVISCFDPVRRELAQKSIERLMKDGRVHPARIEEVVKKVKTEMNTSVKEAGEQACFNLNIHDVHPEIIKTLGGLKYRTIGGMNALEMSKDLSRIAGHIMSEIEGNAKKARQAGLFHALGLNITHTIEGNYSEVGAQLIEKYYKSSDIAQAIRCHTSNIEAQSLLDHVLQIAFNLYYSLPSKKREGVENFITRMKDIESIANSFSGVIRSYAIKFGKELRVLVDSSSVTDQQTILLCSDITKKLQKELDPSQPIKVTVIRESRIVEHAR